MLGIFTILLISVPGSAFASSNSPYDSGYDHGCDDAGISDSSDRYINQPEKGPSFHTSEFMNGYNAGVSSCSSSSNDYNDNYYTPPQSNQRTEVNCDKAGVAGGVLGGLAGALTGSPNVALGGYSAGSTIGKNICESNKN